MRANQRTADDGLKQQCTMLSPNCSALWSCHLAIRVPVIQATYACVLNCISAVGCCMVSVSCHSKGTAVLHAQSLLFCQSKGMSFYDKSDHKGYDALDNELNEELEEMLLRTPPHIQRHLQQRIHDAILTRMKEESTRKCIEFIQKFDKCVNMFPPHKQSACFPHRDAMNDCAHEVNNESNYQKWRVMYLRGELLKLHEARLSAKVEGFKRGAPDSLPSLKVDYAPKYAELMEHFGEKPTGNIGTDDLAGMQNIGVGKLPRPQRKA